MRIEVYGTPGPQGSKRYVGNGIMIESSPKVKPWREAVKWAALQAKPTEDFCIHGPVSVIMTFTLPKPKSARRRVRTFPDKKPDLSKLIRSTEDSLTDAGIWEDDSRVIYCIARKTFPGEGADSLPAPGVVIHVQACDPGLIDLNVG